LTRKISQRIWRISGGKFEATFVAKFDAKLGVNFPENL
jgi:hypothetical protein